MFRRKKRMKEERRKGKKNPKLYSELKNIKRDRTAPLL